MKLFKALFFVLLFLNLSACDYVPWGTVEKNSHKKEFDNNYRKLVDKDAKFIGRGIKVQSAKNYWDWFLPDLNSIAQETSKIYNYPASQNGAKYLRSFNVHGDIGFVWSWEYNGIDIYLIYTFLGGNGYTIRVLHNVDGITVDEAILATYFTTEYSYYLTSFRVEKWEIYGYAGDYTPDSFDFLGDEFYSQGEKFLFFNDRIITITDVTIRKEDEVYCARSDYYNRCPVLPISFNELLASHKVKDKDLLKDNVYANLKVVLNADGEIKEVIAGTIFYDDYLETKFEMLEWSVPDKYLGAGTVSFTYDFEN